MAKKSNRKNLHRPHQWTGDPFEFRLLRILVKSLMDMELNHLGPYSDAPQDELLNGIQAHLNQVLFHLDIIIRLHGMGSSGIVFPDEAAAATEIRNYVSALSSSFEHRRYDYDSYELRDRIDVLISTSGWEDRDEFEELLRGDE